MDNSITVGWVSKLTNRRVVSFSGADATQFLQDMSTNDMAKFKEESL